MEHKTDFIPGWQLTPYLMLGVLNDIKNVVSPMFRGGPKKVLSRTLHPESKPLTLPCTVFDKKNPA